jgi:hypothetical protein
MKKFLLVIIVILMVSCGGSAETPKYGIAKDPNVIDTLPADSVAVKQPADSGTDVIRFRDRDIMK